MHSLGNKEFLSCDWGTSSFRLRWVRGGTIVREYADAVGCKALFDAHSPRERPSAFDRHLNVAIAGLMDNSHRGVPLVISGMASSTIGWVELPYAELPIHLDGSNLIVQKLQRSAPEMISTTYLVSGAASENDMMRGEESEAIGLMATLGSLPASATLILPGTHSKHLRVEHGAVSRIQTFMTGELYELLTKNSVLRASVAIAAPPDLTAFCEGLNHAKNGGAAASLFQVRTRQVLQNKLPASNASFLSGLLIGAELCGLETTANILIGGADSIRQLYSQAAEQLNLDVAHRFSSSDVRLAVPRAHELIMSKLAL